MGRGGRKTYRDDPERRCIVSGETHPKRGLIRFVVSPEGEVVPDVLGRLLPLPGPEYQRVTGFGVDEIWVDDDRLFSLQLLARDSD